MKLLIEAIVISCSPCRLEDTVSVAGDLEKRMGEFHLGARVSGELDDIFKEVSILLLFCNERRETQATADHLEVIDSPFPQIQ